MENLEARTPHVKFIYSEKATKFCEISTLHCKVIIGRNPIEANANTVAIQLPGNPAAYIGKCFTPYQEFLQPLQVFYIPIYLYYTYNLLIYIYSAFHLVKYCNGLLGSQNITYSHTRISDYNFFHSTIIAPLIVFWVSTGAKKFKKLQNLLV